VNCDGTGYDLVPPKPGDKLDEGDVARLEGLFNEPCPLETMIRIRRALRRDLESTGNGYLEVLRAVDGQIVGFRHVPATMMRLVKLDKAVLATKTVQRGGKDFPITMWVRERRFAQKIGYGLEHVYFREFGASRQVNRLTGEWEDPANPLTPEQRGSELIHFRVSADPEGGAYGIPRWIGQLPSVIGSRKAEESSLEYLDAGGIPPVIVFVHGGRIATDMANELRLLLSGQRANKSRGAVVEATPATGDLNSAGKVSVTVERFGADAVKDSMYGNYDKRCEERIRKGFRLPSLFVGDSQDANYATAAVSYMVAEAQVFGPERLGFDEVMNITVVRGLGVKGVRLHSKPITLKTVADQLTALGIVKDMVDGEGLVEQVNQVAGLSLKYEEPEPVPAQLQPGAGDPEDPNDLPPDETAKPPKGKGLPKPAKGVGGSTKNKGKVAKGGEEPRRVAEVVQLAQDFVRAHGFVPDEPAGSDAERARVNAAADALGAEDRALFGRFLSVHIEAIQAALDADPPPDPAPAPAA